MRYKSTFIILITVFFLTILGRNNIHIDVTKLNLIKMKSDKNITGKVVLDLDEELNYSELNDGNTKIIANVVKQTWESYLKMDKEGYSKNLSKNVRKMSQRTRKISDSLTDVVAGLSDEWEAFERPNNIIAEEMTLRNISFWADDEDSPTVVIVNYWVEIEGGTRWKYDDQGLVLQVFKKESGSWYITPMAGLQIMT